MKPRDAAPNPEAERRPSAEAAVRPRAIRPRTADAACSRFVRAALLSLPCLLAFAACRAPAPADPGPPLESLVSGERAWEDLAALVAIGPRPPGSPALEETRDYLETRLASLGWSVERDEFTARDPLGEEHSFVNLRARYAGPGAARRRAAPLGVLAAPYSTKRFASYEFVGANDGGSGAALLLEFASALSERPGLASRIEIVLLDGEEAFGPRVTQRDGLYGSRRYAAAWQSAPPAKRPRWAMIFDGLGGADVRLRAAARLPGESLRELRALSEGGYAIDVDALEQSLARLSGDLLDAAEDLGLRREAGISPDYLLGSHLPFGVVAGVPAILLTDPAYAYRHSPSDTLDRLSPDSLEIAGRVAARWLERQAATR